MDLINFFPGAVEVLIVGIHVLWPKDFESRCETNWVALDKTLTGFVGVRHMTIVLGGFGHGKISEDRLLRWKSYVQCKLVLAEQRGVLRIVFSPEEDPTQPYVIRSTCTDGTSLAYTA